MIVVQKCTIILRKEWSILGFYAKIACTYLYFLIVRPELIMSKKPFIQLPYLYATSFFKYHLAMSGRAEQWEARGGVESTRFDVNV